MKVLRAALWLCHDVTLPSVRRHRARMALTIVGVMIGTQVVVAIGIMNRSIMESFEHTVMTIAGWAELQASNAAGGLPEELSEELAATPGVAGAEGLIRETVRTPSGDLTVFGVDFLAEQGVWGSQLRNAVHIRDSATFVAAPDSIALSTIFAQRAGIALGSQIEVTSSNGQHVLTVRGLIDPIGPAALFDGAVGLVDLPTAQGLFKRGRRVDQINIALEPGADLFTVRRRLAPIVEPVGALEAPREHGANLGSMLTAVRILLTLASLNAALVGFFIIYHTMTSAVLQRRRELALARAVGFRRGAQTLAIMLEALACGFVGSALGFALGILAASLSLDLLTESVATLYARIDSPGMSLRSSDVFTAAGVGIGSALAAALIPARQAARMPIVEQLRTSPGVSWAEAKTLRPTLAGVGVSVAGLAVLGSGIHPDHFVARVTLIMGGYVLVAVGYALLLPAALRLILKPVGRLSQRFRSAGPELVIESIAQHPDRTRGTVAALMVAFALVLLVGTYIRSFRSSTLTWLDQVFASDFYIAASPDLPSPSGLTMPGVVEEALRSHPEVVAVEVTRMLNVTLGDGAALLRTHSAQNLGRLNYPVVDHAGPDYLNRFADGEAVFISDNLAYAHGLCAGDTVTIATPSGPRTFDVGAVVVDYTRDSGTLIVEREVYKTTWKDGSANQILVWCKPGTSLEVLRRTIADHLRPIYPTTILTTNEYKANVALALDQALLLPYAMQIIGILVAIIGVVNFLVTEIIDRRREIGLLRSVALTQRQLTRLLVVEALVIGVFGGLSAVLYAWPTSFLVVTRAQRLISGWSLTFDFPVLLSITTVCVAAVTAGLAAYYPARRAAKTLVADLVATE